MSAGGGGKGRPDQQAAQLGIDEDRAIAVPPVEGKQPALARPEGPCLAFEDAVDVEAFAGRSIVDLRWRRLLREPREDVAHRRLTGLVAEQARHDPVLDDAAHALGSRRAVAQHEMARAGPHHRDQGAGPCHADGRDGHVRVDIGHRDRRARPKTGPARRFRRETARTPSERRDDA